MSKYQVVMLERLLPVFFDSAGIDDFCRQLVHDQGLLPSKPTGAHVLLVNSKSELRSLGGYGHLELKDSEIGTIWGNNPLSIAIQKGEISFLDVSSQDGQEMLVLVPLLRKSLPVGLVVIEYPDKANFESESEAFKLISLLGGYLPGWLELRSRQNSVLKTDQNAGQELTTRQKRILSLIADGLSNFQIAEIVLVSESTVRQETIRIYRLLAVPNRHEAMQKARAIGIIN